MGDFWTILEGLRPQTSNAHPYNKSRVAFSDTWPTTRHTEKFWAAWLQKS